MTDSDLTDIGFVKHSIDENDHFYLYYFTYYNEGDAITISTPFNSTIENNNWVALTKCGKVFKTPTEIRDYISQTLQDIYPDGY